MPKRQTKKPKGPEPDRLKIEDTSWQEAMGKAIKKERPKDGQPETDEKTDDRPDK